MLAESQDCEIDINCIEGDEWQTLKRSICQIETPRLLCSGTLVNNTSYNGVPYVLTAEHCLNNELYPQNSVFTFGYENSECFGDDANMEKSVSGAYLIATGDSIDFTLVRLTKRPPREYDVYYAGWDMRKTNFNSSVTLHHPNADAMKISFDFDPMATPTSLPGDLNDYIVASNFWIKQWDIGTTEGGSSGSGLFNDHKRIIGVLSGGLAGCGEPIGFDEEKNRTIFSLQGNTNDYYTRLYYAWDYYSEPSKHLKTWLDPNLSGKVAVGGLNAKVILNSGSYILQQSGLKIYPNPSGGMIYMEAGDYPEGPVSLEVFNVAGTLVLKRDALLDQVVNIDLTSMQEGLYLFRIQGRNYTAVEKVIISR